MSLEKRATIFIVKSEFNRNLVEELYESALIEFKAYSQKQYQSQKQSQAQTQDQSQNQTSILTKNQSYSQNQRKLDLKSYWVPGAGEIPQAVQWILDQGLKTKQFSESSLELYRTGMGSQKTEELKKQTGMNRETTNREKSKKSSKTEPSIAGVLALGVIIRGKTSHFDFLNDFLQTALWDLQKNSSVPIVFSVLMLENKTQFKDRVIRASEAMKALLKMIHLKDELSRRID